MSNKEQLMAGANDYGFKSDFHITDYTEMSDKVYYLWMCELQKDLRDNKNVEIEVSRMFGNYLPYGWIRINPGGLITKGFGNDDKHVDYDDALESGLTKALKQLNDE